MSNTDRNTPTITNFNWQRYSNTVHLNWMQHMGIRIGTTQEVTFLGLEYAGESGELANKIKKYWRDGPSLELHRGIRGEIADCMIILAHIAKFFGMDLDDCSREKLEELFERWKWMRKLPDHRLEVEEMTARIAQYGLDRRNG